MFIPASLRRTCHPHQGFLDQEKHSPSPISPWDSLFVDWGVGITWYKCLVKYIEIILHAIGSTAMSNCKASLALVPKILYGRNDAIDLYHAKVGWQKFYNNRSKMIGASVNIMLLEFWQIHTECGWWEGWRINDNIDKIIGCRNFPSDWELSSDFLPVLYVLFIEPLVFRLSEPIKLLAIKLGLFVYDELLYGAQ